MHPAVEIGQGEIRRIERCQYPLSLRRRLAEAPCVEFGIRNYRLSEQTRQRREIVTRASTVSRDELALARLRHRHADIALAEALRLVPPSAYSLEVRAREP